MEQFSILRYVVQLDAHSVNLLNNCLDIHWCLLELFNDFESELSGIGNRSFD